MMSDRRCAGLVAAAALALVVGACGDDAAVGQSTVTVGDVWSRTSAATQTAGVVYFEVVAGESDDALIGASVSSEIAASAEIHETVPVDSTTMSMGGTTMGGGMVMRPVAAVPVGAGETVSFEPGGYHVMLMGLTAPLMPGQTFEVTLVFEHAGEVVVTATVRD
jgi:hypothetical protein